MGGAGGGRFARGATMLGWTAVLQMEVRSPLEADRPGGTDDGRWGCGASPIACKAAFAKAALRIEGSFRRANGSSPLPAAAADSGFRRRRSSNPGVMEEGTAAAASQPPSAGASADMTTDDVLATMGF